MNDAVVNTVRILKTCFACGRAFSTVNFRICSTCRTQQRNRNRARYGWTNRCLTFREKQVVDLVSQAKLNKEIAFELRLTEGTIKEYLNRIFKKLQVKNRTELALWALREQVNGAHAWAHVPPLA